MIQFVEEGQEMWKGYLYVVVLGITSFLSGGLYHKFKGIMDKVSDDS